MTMILLPRFSLLLVVAFLSSCPLKGQAPDHLPGQILVSLLPNVSPEKLTGRSDKDLAAPIMLREKVAELLHIWRLETAPNELAETAALEWLRRQPEVQSAQLNHFVTYRANPPDIVLPNDPLISQQWHYVNSGSNGGVFDADLDAEQAWELATGGLTAVGDTVVVAVIDGGVDFQHPDLAPNAWFNWDEIPNDGLDNDENGFIDDFRGWNTVAFNDDVSGQTTGHGTPVCGIVGARGNNGIGVAGVSWQVKIMFVAGGGTESAILAAYDYVLAARRRYNTTNGKHGAFVTALNCSWGIDAGQPLEAPLWCAAFDTLGAAGILSVAATTNLPLNVDVTGDLPTACSSDYLITVTSLQRNDQKAILAGWGVESIDLGAYGQNVFTLGAGNTYGSFSGTSFAAPQVSGAVALLYSMPCANLVAVAKNDPATAALWVKDLLLGSTTPNASLAAFTKTGGRLNLYNFLEDYTELCNPCPAPFSLSANVVDEFAVLTWSQIPDYQIFNLQYRPMGQTVWSVKEGVSSPYILPLSGVCQPYEFSVQAYCQSGQASAWSAPVDFTSAGCCAPPEAITLQMAGATTLSLTWPDVAAAGSWIVRYRVVGSNALWLKVVANSNALTLNNLHPCTSYEIQIQSECNGAYTPFSMVAKFTTEGCGSCTSMPYCTANAGQSSGEWISSVSVGNWMQSSGNGGGGYQNFTGDQYVPLELYPLEALPVTVTPGFFGTPIKEYFRIYVDFNADGDFTDAGELAFDPGYAQNGPISGQLQTTAFEHGGFTRMRVLMKAKNATNAAPMPCESFDFGQIEDYCVLLTLPVTATETADTKAGKLKIFPQPAHSTVTLEWQEISGETALLQVWNMAGQLMLSQSVGNVQQNVQLDVHDWPAGPYLVSLQTEQGIWQEKLIKY